ncbi:putative toxin-antitoxin system toxin component, PIN family [Candidatus Woesearchaeota archaeon]|nr:putative toxin-antitoxin system toxin component, PIN family [Candidatus Woesearchaeota archaeon]|tara:strand:- start:3250 stop:3660 length:411 start_codon:yes stop_codon:yes gene_type:complete
MGEKKIILDTNILISALGWEGNPRIIFNKVIGGEFELILSYKQLDELLRVLNYPKFKFTDKQKDRFLLILSEISTLVETKSKVKVIKDDPDDNIILEPASEMKIEYIISGNDHLLKLKEFKGTKIITAKGFLGLEK